MAGYLCNVKVHMALRTGAFVPLCLCACMYSVCARVLACVCVFS
jgi:hypothetical protein